MKLAASLLALWLACSLLAATAFAAWAARGGPDVASRPRCRPSTVSPVRRRGE